MDPASWLVGLPPTNYNIRWNQAFPIYTIGYNTKLDLLRDISAINEAASLHADKGDIAYKIGGLLNAAM